MRRNAIGMFAILAGVAGLLAAQPNPVPIPQQPGLKPAPLFVGNPAIPRPIVAPAIPPNPFMAAGGWSAVHNDTYMSDTYFTGGPLGRSPEVLSTFLGTQTATGLVVTMLFGADGRIVAASTVVDLTVSTVQVKLVLIDPSTLATIDTLPFSEPRPTEITPQFRPAGVYAYLDQFDRVIAATADRTIWVV